MDAKVVWTGIALCLVVACGRSSSRKRSDASGGNAGTASQAGGSNSGGRAGTSPIDGGEAGWSDSAGRANESGGVGGSVGGEPGTGGSVAVGGTSPAGAGGQTAGSGVGASSGDSGTSGSAGAGGMPDLPLPDGCEPRGRTEDDDSCSLGVFCGSVPNLANCTRLQSGNWRCSCELANNDRTYEISGAPGVEACAVAVGLCFEDELELGEEVCSEDEGSNADACDLDLTCGKPIAVPFASDVTASLVDYGHAECGRSGDGQPFECVCEHGGVTRDYGVLAEHGSLACRPLADFCRQDVEPVFDQPEVCIERYASASDELCDLYWTCATPMRLTDEVSLAELEPRYANCTETETGARCYCSGRTEVFGFDLEDAPSAATCESSIANCAEDVSIVATGEADCRTTSETAGADFCEADLDCLQPATVDERRIVAQGRLLVHCMQSTDDDSWWCSCASNQDSAIFEYGVTEKSSWDICLDAPAGCIERMPVFLGPYGEFMYPPYPLPME